MKWFGISRKPATLWFIEPQYTVSKTWNISINTAFISIYVQHRNILYTLDIFSFFLPLLPKVFRPFRRKLLERPGSSGIRLRFGERFPGFHRRCCRCCSSITSIRAIASLYSTQVSECCRCSNILWPMLVLGAAGSTLLVCYCRASSVRRPSETHPKLVDTFIYIGDYGRGIQHSQQVMRLFRQVCWQALFYIRRIWCWATCISGWCDVAQYSIYCIRYMVLFHHITIDLTAQSQTIFTHNCLFAYNLL